MGITRRKTSEADNNQRTEPFHLLVVEDRTLDLKSLLTALGERGVDARATKISEPSEFKPAMVTSGKWELILTPVSLAPEILNGLKHCEGNGPRVIIFGPTEDMTTVEFLQQGAADVVRVQPPERLQLVIARELGFIAERRARIELEQMTQRYKQSYGKLPDGGVPSNPDTTARADTSSSPTQDLLTGLYTRSYFTRELEKTLANRESLPDNNVLLHVAVDDFDFVRDKYGVAAADLALADVANILRDNVGENSIPCRFGARAEDNVFLVMIRDVEMDEIENIAERVRVAVAKNNSEVAGKMLKVTCSVGICRFDSDVESVKKILYWAALAAQIAQKEGGDRIHVYNPQADAKAARIKGEEQESRVLSALKKENFKLVYLPIVNLCAEPAERYEVFLRMLDEQGKEILPAQFIPAAEKGGLMPAVDRWVIKHAIETVGERQRQGHKTNFFIKVSVDGMLDKKLLSWVATNLKSARVPGDAVTFEITESAVMSHPKEARVFLKGLKELHCRTALERAGANPDALEALDDLPLDVIKFDRSLNHDFPHNPAKQEKLKKLVKEAHKLNREAIAEFVQDAKTLRLLWQCSIDYIQGYYLQQPDAKLAYEFSEAS